MKKSSPTRMTILIVVLVLAAYAFHRFAGDMRDWLIAMHGGRTTHGGR